MSTTQTLPPPVAAEMVTDTLPAADTLLRVATAARSAANAKRAKRAADAGWKAAESDGITVMTGAEMLTTLVPEADGTVTRVTVEGLTETRTTISLDMLAELLPSSVFDSITVQRPVLDAELLATAVAVGAVPAKVLELATTVTEVRPTLRVTFNAKTDEGK